METPYPERAPEVRLKIGLIALLSDAFEINDQFHAARIFTQEFGDAVVGEGDFEAAFKTAPESMVKLYSPSKRTSTPGSIIRVSPWGMWTSQAMR